MTDVRFTPVSRHAKIPLNKVFPERGHACATPRNLENPEFWRFRAEEVRTIAESMRDGEPKRIMLKIAQDYEKIAKHVEQQAR